MEATGLFKGKRLFIELDCRGRGVEYVAAREKLLKSAAGTLGVELCTHISADLDYAICSHMDQAAAHQALEAGVPVASSDWLLASVTENKLQDILQFKPHPAACIPGFQDFHIALTGISPGLQRKEVFLTITYTGAEPQKEVVLGTTTHLVANPADPAGPSDKLKKVLRAIARGKAAPRVVTPDWLHKCLEVWQHVPEDAYEEPFRQMVADLMDAAAAAATASTGGCGQLEADVCAALQPSMVCEPTQQVTLQAPPPVTGAVAQEGAGVQPSGAVPASQQPAPLPVADLTPEQHKEQAGAATAELGAPSDQQLAVAAAVAAHAPPVDQDGWMSRRKSRPTYQSQPTHQTPATQHTALEPTLPITPTEVLLPESHQANTSLLLPATHQVQPTLPAAAVPCRESHAAPCRLGAVQPSPAAADMQQLSGSPGSYTGTLSDQESPPLGEPAPAPAPVAAPQHPPAATVLTPPEQLQSACADADIVSNAAGSGLQDSLLHQIRLCPEAAAPEAPEVAPASLDSPGAQAAGAAVVSTELCATVNATDISVQVAGSGVGSGTGDDVPLVAEPMPTSGTAQLLPASGSLDDKLGTLGSSMLPGTQAAWENVGAIAFQLTSARQPDPVALPPPPPPPVPPAPGAPLLGMYQDMLLAVTEARVSSGSQAAGSMSQQPGAGAECRDRRTAGDRVVVVHQPGPTDGEADSPTAVAVGGDLTITRGPTGDGQVEVAVTSSAPEALPIEKGGRQGVDANDDDEDDDVMCGDGKDGSAGVEVVKAVQQAAGESGRRRSSRVAALPGPRKQKQAKAPAGRKQVAAADVKVPDEQDVTGSVQELEVLASPAAAPATAPGPAAARGSRRFRLASVRVGPASSTTSPAPALDVGEEEEEQGRSSEQDARPVEDAAAPAAVASKKRKLASSAEARRVRILKPSEPVENQGKGFDGKGIKGIKPPASGTGGGDGVARTMARSRRQPVMSDSEDDDQEEAVQAKDSPQSAVKAQQDAAGSHGKGRKARNSGAKQRDVQPASKPAPKNKTRKADEGGGEERQAGPSSKRRKPAAGVDTSPQVEPALVGSPRALRSGKKPSAPASMSPPPAPAPNKLKSSAQAAARGASNKAVSTPKAPDEQAGGRGRGTTASNQADTRARSRLGNAGQDDVPADPKKRNPGKVKQAGNTPAAVGTDKEQVQPSKRRKTSEAVVTHRPKGNQRQADGSALPLASPATCRFALTCMEEPMRSQAVTQLKLKLKAKLAEYEAGKSWDPRITHMLLGTPVKKRSQKAVVGMAAGAWLMDGSRYLNACDSAGCLLQPDSFELQEGPNIDQGAPQHWRERRARLGVGAFAGLCAVILGDPTPPFNCAAIKEMLTAGGGQVVKEVPNISQKALERALATDPRPNIVIAAANTDPQMLKLVSKANLTCVQPAYLVSWVCQPFDSLPDELYLRRGRHTQELDRLEAARSTTSSLKTAQKTETVNSGSVSL